MATRLNKEAALFNLIVYLGSSTEGYPQNLLLKYPGRLITIVHSQEISSFEVTSHQHPLDKQNPSLVREHIQILIHPTQDKRLPFILLPLLLPDIPTYLFFAQDRIPQTLIFSPLKRYLSGLIIDPKHHLPNPLTTELLTLHKLMPLPILDLQWLSLTGWRNAFSQCFQDPNRFEALTHIRKLEIHGQSSLQMLYFQNWLAARLNWKKKSPLLYTTHNQPIEVITENHSIPTPLSSVSIECEKISYYLQLATHPNRIVAQGFYQDRCDVPFSIPLTDPFRGGRLLKELLHPSTHSHYWDMLETLNAPLKQEVSS